MEVAFFWVFQQKFRLFDKFHNEIVCFFDNRVHFYSFSVFERKKRWRSFKNPSVQCDFQSEILQNHKTLITLDWGLYLTSKGHFWRFHFLSFSKKIGTFWSISLRNRMFFLECIFTLSRFLKEKKTTKIFQESISPVWFPMWNFAKT